MFNATVTLFNFFRPDSEYYATLLTGVELQPFFKTSFTDDATLEQTSSLLIFPPSATKKPFKPPKIWDNFYPKETAFTLRPGEDFFIIGDYSQISAESYENFKENHDGVFLITGVKNFRFDLPHFEVMGA